MLKKIVSGGQTGADRAALDAAIHCDITYGGWCPLGRLDELGIIPAHYILQEIEGVFSTELANYAARTVQNIIDSDGTLILVPQLPSPEHIKDGTILTINEVARQNKPYLMFDLSMSIDSCSEQFNEWLIINSIEILNVAGPRESSCPGIYDASLILLTDLIKAQHELKAKFSF